MGTSTDQLNRTITLTDYPRRIISVVPSQTELLFSLGLNDEVVGITKFCVHPDQWFRTKIRVGGTKKLNIERIRSLNPDLIIANREENTKEDIDILSKEFPVWVSDIKKLDDALSMILETGRIVNREQTAINLVNDITRRFDSLKADAQLHLSCIYMIWKNPYMAAGGDTFISDMLTRSGFDNLLKDSNRYPELTPEQILTKKPDVILLSSEPYPFKEKDAEEIRLALPGIKVYCVDGEMFSWYGSRLLKAVEYFGALKKLISKSR